MTALAEKFRDRFFRPEDHPYYALEREVQRHLTPSSVLLDAGCGQTAPLLHKFVGLASRLIGLDVYVSPAKTADVEIHAKDLSATELPDESVDVIMSRSVVEHLDDPIAVFREFRRILAPGGVAIILTANYWDYASLIAAAIPNRFHAAIVSRTEGREEADVFPTRYRCNTRRAVTRCADAAGLQVADFQYLGQHPSYFMFNGALYLMATGYEKLISRVDALEFLRGWLFFTLRKPAGN